MIRVHELGWIRLMCMNGRTSFMNQSPGSEHLQLSAALRQLVFLEKRRWFSTCGRTFHRLEPELHPKLKHHHGLGLPL